MKKITAILLAMLMVAFCFATTAMADDASTDISVDASSEDSTSEDITSEDSTSEDATSEDPSDDEPEIEFINVSLGKTYTIDPISEETNKPFYQGACDDGMGEGYYLTDGIVRDVEELTASGAGNMDKTVELAGTNRTHFITIDLGDAQDVGMVVLGTVRRGNNRYTNIASIEVLVNGAYVPVEWLEVAEAIEGAEQYGSETIEAYDQFFNVYAMFDLVDTTSIRIGIDTQDNEGIIAHYGPRGYVAQLDEISVYTVVMPEESTDGSVDVSDDDVSVDDTTSTAPSKPSTPTAGDLGLGVFAVLAVVSLAGVVVAKKVK